jgi:L-seryl-tRNA(Ser) seleniumtransferase
MVDLRALPSIDELLQTTAAQTYVAEVRKAYPKTGRVPEIPQLLSRVEQLLENWTELTLRPVINATGVILHTNLGRAPLSQAANEAIQAVSAGYSSLEYNLEKGERGSRLVHAEALLQRLTGAEAALVVNNNAAAVLLVLSALARRRRVLIARSQLVEIGGGFRVPDVMKQSGAKLVEVGTTNRVHLADYETALEEPAALVMLAHRSNFQIVGFTSEPLLAEISNAAHQAGVPVLDDLGSGSLLDTAAYGMAHEPTISESLAAGADLVCFSGDKLLGGPQAGIILGRRELLTKIKKYPLARAVRADKLCLAALTATLLHYLKDEALNQIPIWRMIATPLEKLQTRAAGWKDALNAGQVIHGESTVGGGSLPGESLPTALLALEIANPNRFLARLRQAPLPVIARITEDRVVLDPRTVLPEQDALLVAAVQEAFKEQPAD